MPTDGGIRMKQLTLNYTVLGKLYFITQTQKIMVLIIMYDGRV